MSQRRSGLVRAGFRRAGTPELPFAGFGTQIAAVGSTNSPGVLDLGARVDHVHAGPIKSVANVAALAALDAAGFGNGDTWAYVQTYKAYFCLVASTAAASANVRVAALNKAGFLWIRFLESSAWWSQLAWVVDPANSSGTASDENTGASAILPLATFAELGRRFRGRNLPGVETNSFAVTLLSDAADTDYLQIHLDANFRNAVVNVTVNGTVTAVAVGTIAAAVAKNAALNQPNTITVVGFNWATHVGKILRLVGTPTTTAVIKADLGANTAQLEEQNVNGVVGAGFAAAQVVEIASKPKLGGVSTNGGLGVLTVINDVSFSPASTVALTAISRGAGSGGITCNRCEFRPTAASTFEAENLTFTGCSFVGQTFNLYGTVNTNMSSVINGSLLLQRSAVNRAHLASSGLYNATITAGDGMVVRLNGDFNAFALPAAAAGILQRYGSIVYQSGTYYGGGNNAASAGIKQIAGTQWFYVVVPTMNAGQALYTDATDGAGLAGGASVAWAALPMVPTAKLNAMVAG